MKNWAARPKGTQQLATRSRIVLACGDGLDNKDVATRLCATAQTVGMWRKRFIDGLTDRERSGTPRKVAKEEAERDVTKTLETKPKNASHWNTRGIADATGLSQSTISRGWRVFGLKPHRSGACKLSIDPSFVEQRGDVVGLYTVPPERAIVLCVDEKSQIQASDRIQPLLLMQSGPPVRRTHGYARTNTTSLFAGQNVATDEVIGCCLRRHRTQEFLKFLDAIVGSAPKDPGWRSTG